MRKERVVVAGEEIFARRRNRDTWAALDARPFFIFTILLPLCLLEIIIIWAIFADFRGRGPRLYSEISDFQNLSVLGDFYALHHFVCHHRYT